MNLRLNQIATIQTGAFAKHFSEGEVMYLLSNYFDEEGVLNDSYRAFLSLDLRLQKHLLKQGDVLISAKGKRNFAVMYENKNGLAVASSSFFVIRITKEYREKVLPEFIAWFLNHPSTQAHLKAGAKGTDVQSITKQVLEPLEISIPAIDVQKSVLQITDLRTKEKMIMQQIDSLREKQIQFELINALK